MPNYLDILEGVKPISEIKISKNNKKIFLFQCPFCDKKLNELTIAFFTDLNTLSLSL